jgi:hypothetical protein
MGSAEDFDCGASANLRRDWARRNLDSPDGRLTQSRGEKGENCDPVVLSVVPPRLRVRHFRSSRGITDVSSLSIRLHKPM